MVGLEPLSSGVFKPNLLVLLTDKPSRLLLHPTLLTRSVTPTIAIWKFSVASELERALPEGCPMKQCGRVFAPPAYIRPTRNR